MITSTFIHISNVSMSPELTEFVHLTGKIKRTKFLLHVSEEENPTTNFPRLMNSILVIFKIAPIHYCKFGVGANQQV